MIKNNKNLAIGIAAVILILLAGGIFLLFSKKTETKQLPVTEEASIPALKPEDIGLTLEMDSSGQKVIMKIENVSDITSVDYQLSYTSTGDIPRGAIGHLDVKNGQPINQQIVLGTCSDVCHYDDDVSDIKLVVKVTKTDGSVYEVEQSL